MSLVWVLPPEIWKYSKRDSWAARAESSTWGQKESSEGRSEEGKNTSAGGVSPPKQVTCSCLTLMETERQPNLVLGRRKMGMQKNSPQKHHVIPPWKKSRFVPSAGLGALDMCVVWGRGMAGRIVEQERVYEEDPDSVLGVSGPLLSCLQALMLLPHMPGPLLTATGGSDSNAVCRSQGKSDISEIPQLPSLHS